MTTADTIAGTLRPLAPGQTFTPHEVELINLLAAEWDARRSDAPTAPRPTLGLALGEAAVIATGGRQAKLKTADAFYARLRNDLFRGGLKPGQFEGVEALLATTGAAQWPASFAAYALATAYHETARTMQPIKEYGGPAYFRKMYDIEGARPAKARELGNLTPGDGAKYAGRGYVQLTGKTNYAKAQEATGAPLVDQPDLAMKPDIAAKILRWGMSSGAFTGKSLSDYLTERVATVPQFRQARRIINGLDKADTIAGYAEEFQAALEAGEWA